MAKILLLLGLILAISPATAFALVSPPTLVAGSAMPCLTLSHNLHRGLSESTDGDVSALQSFLVKDNLLDATIAAAGYGTFGFYTQRAVIAFQARYNIAPAVGYVGPITRNEIHVLTCGAASAENQPPVASAVSAPSSSGLSLVVRTNKNSYKPGEAININIELDNPTTKSITMTFNSSCQSSYTVKSMPLRQTVYSSPAKPCTENAKSLEVPSYGTFVWELKHELGAAPLEAGVYIIEASMDASANAPQPAQTASFRISAL